MSEFKTILRWQRTTPDFTYDTYDRTHALTVGSGSTFSMSSAQEFRGNPALVNPEELLVAALSSCHMLSFLAIAARKRLVVDSYQDDAEGRMTKNAQGKLFVSHVTLRPRVKFASAVDPQTLDDLHHRAHHECFIANSVVTDVRVEAANEVK